MRDSHAAISCGVIVLTSGCTNADYNRGERSVTNELDPTGHGKVGHNPALDRRLPGRSGCQALQLADDYQGAPVAISAALGEL